MPYIIETITPYMWQGNGPNRNAGKARIAVATLGEARDAVGSMLPDGYAFEVAGMLQTTSEKTIGPLPDGTVIEVRRVDRLGSLAGEGVDAFNAAQA